MKIYHLSAFLIIVLLFILYLSGCQFFSGSSDSTNSQYKVTYEANGTDSGTCPNDEISYSSGDTMIIRNQNSLSKTDYYFVCWNTAPDGRGTDHLAGSVYTFGNSDLHLYAKWIHASHVYIYTVSFDVNGADSGSVPDDMIKIEGYDLVLPGNTGAMKRNGFFFKGWNTKPDGSGTAFFPGDEISKEEPYVLYSEWVSELKYTAHDGGPDDWYGYSVAVDNHYAVIGAYGDDNGLLAGCVYVYYDLELNPGKSVFELFPADITDGNWFGCSVDISGDYIVAGARYGDGLSTDTGSIYIYEKTELNTWGNEVMKYAADGNYIDAYGFSAAIDGDYCVAGVFKDDDDGDDSGSVWVYNNTGNHTWDSGVKITAGDAAAYDYFGYAVGISGDFIVVGAYRDDDNGADSGSVYVYERTGTNTWGNEIKIKASDGSADDRFGNSVASNGSYFCTGAFYDDENGTNSGSAYVYYLP